MYKHSILTIIALVTGFAVFAQSSYADECEKPTSAGDVLGNLKSFGCNLGKGVTIRKPYEEYDVVSRGVVPGLGAGYCLKGEPMPHLNSPSNHVNIALIPCSTLESSGQFRRVAAATTGTSGTGASRSDVNTPAVGTITSGKDLRFADCYGRFTEPAEQQQIAAAGMPDPKAYKLCLNRRTGAPESLLNLSPENRHMYDLPKGFTTVDGQREDGSLALPANAQAGWDKVDRIQKEGIEKIQADSAARESANADKDLIRKAAFEKCKPLISGDNSRMESFKTCFQKATK